MARWRTWDLDCLQETLVSRQNENEVEPLIVPGCTREIPSLNLGSVVLPKEAFLSPNDGGSVRARGRGRSLANRALGFDKPSRRPGERDVSDKGNPTVENPKPTTLGSQFLGSGYLYEELFPSLDQSSTKKSDPNPSIPTTSVWGGKQKSKKGKQSHQSVRVAEQATNNESSFFEKSTRDKFKSKQSDALDNSTNKDQKKITSFLENCREEISEKSDVDSDTIKLPSSTFYNCANVKNKTEIPGSFFEESKDKPRSDQVNVPNICKNDEQVIAEISDINSDENDSQFNKVGFGRIEAISGESDWQSDEEEFGTIENKLSLQSSSLETINSADCMTTTESGGLHKDKQSEKLIKLSDMLEIDDHKNSNPKDYVRELQWIESENNDQLSEQCNNDEVNICDQLSDYLGVKEDQHSTSPKDDNFQEADWIESKDNQLFQKYDNDDNKILSHLLDQLGLKDHQNPKDYSQDMDSVESDNSNHISDQLSSRSCEETLICDKTKHLEISDSNEQLSTNGCISSHQDAKADHTQPLKDSSTIISTSTNHLLSQSDSEGPEYIETNDTKENLDESLDMSTSDVEMEPCNILLENLPLALSEEELRDIVEPYGEMESYNFNVKDDSSKTCTVRMPNSMSGELLVVSLDGLEVDGYRIKAKMDDS